MLIEILRRGLVTISSQHKKMWWSPEDIEEEQKVRAPLGLSELDTCPRRVWYKYNEPTVTNETNPDMHVVWWIGSFVENIIVRALESQGVKIGGRQTEIVWEGVPGHVDGIICTDDHPDLAAELGPGRKFLLELKSAKEKKIKDARKKGIREAFPGYFMQMQAYLVAWELTFGERLDGAIMLMGNKAVDFVKGDSPTAWYEELIPRDSLYAEAQMAYIQTVIKEPEVVPIPYVKPDPLCNFCPFAAKCWKGTPFEYDMLWNKVEPETVS